MNFLSFERYTHIFSGWFLGCLSGIRLLLELFLVIGFVHESEGIPIRLGLSPE